MFHNYLKKDSVMIRIYNVIILTQSACQINSIVIFVAKFSKGCYNAFAVLDGELAVPCKLQPAIAVSNADRGLLYGWSHQARNVDSKVRCNVVS